MMAVEENAKKMSRDIDIYRGGSETYQLSSGNGGARSRGTKDLMRALQNTISDEVTDVDGEENEDVHDWDTDEE